ncbi:MAG TPA: hypothetical protein HA224_02425 [Nanoarchaeota archaeon]|nr:hypothetical protein [Nanoarchaeota archaeon]
MSFELGAAKLGIKEAAVWKFDMLVWIIISLVSLGTYYLLWTAVYGFSGQGVIAGYSLRELITYFVLSEIVQTLTWTSIIMDLSQKIRRGTLITQLARPINFLYYHFWMNFGSRGLQFLIYCIPMVLIGALLFGMKFTGWTNLALFSASAGLAMVLNFALSAFIALGAFWLTSYHGIRWAYMGLFSIFSGFIFPLTFFPQFWQKVFSFLPFQYIIFVPVQTYLGKYGIFGALGNMLIQIVWIIILMTAISFIWRRAMKSFTAPGG